MNITEQAAQALREIDAALALAEKAHGDVPPDYTYCPGLADYYEAATDNRGWPLSLRCLKTAIEGLEAAHVALPDGDDAAWNALTNLLDTWEAAGMARLDYMFSRHHQTQPTTMIDQPTPRTAAFFAARPLTLDGQTLLFCEGLERELNALRVAFRLAPDERIPAQTPRPGTLLVETGSSRRRVSPTDERDDAELAAAQQTVARLREVLQRIVNNGGSATNAMLFDARAALATPAK